MHTIEQNHHCSKCKEDKKISEFGSSKSNKDGLSSYCLQCYRIIAKNWYAENKEKAKACQKKWREENPDKHKECVKTWRLKNPSKKKEYQGKWYKSHRLTIAKRKIHFPENRNTKNNVLHNAGYSWLKYNHEKYLEVRRRRRLRIKENGGIISKGLRDRLFVLQMGMCACCRTDLINSGSHMDHIIPIAKGGKNEDRNIQLLCPKCNKSKHHKDPIDFMRSRGFLL